MERYEKYKDSEIEWIGEIPEHWKVKKVKYLSKNFDGKRIPLNSGQRAKITGDIPYYGANGIVDYVNDFLFDGEYVLIGEDGAPFFIKNRDVAFLVKGKFWVNNHAHILKINQRNNPKIIAYLFNCVDYKEYITGSTRDKLTQDQLSSIKLLKVPFKEQTAIANYLDHKTAEIDELINQKEQLLKLYEEEKTAIINQVVTKGINPDVKLKDSGIDWLGEILEHWEVKKLKYVVKLITEKSNGDFKKVGLENIESNSGKFIETNSEFQGEGIRFQIGDILYGKLRPYLSKVLLSDFEGAAVGDFFVLRPNVKYLSDFIKYRLLSSSFTEISNSSTYGSKMPRVSWEFMSHLFFALPIEEEQTTIVQFIETEVSLINSKSEKTKKLIDLLKEYKTALISEVVTGKIKVM